jgi:hypothetical protein
MEFQARSGAAQAAGGPRTGLVVCPDHRSRRVRLRQYKSIRDLN